MDRLAVGEGLARDEHAAQIHADASEDLITLVDEIVAAAKLDQLILGLLDSIDIEVVTDHSVPGVGQNHLPLGVELVVAGLDRLAVGEGLARDERAAQVYTDILQELVALVNEVEITLKLHQLVLLQADVVFVEIIADRAVLSGRQRGDGLGAERLTAVLTELLPLPFRANRRRLDGDPHTGSVTLGGDHGLCHEDFTAHRAVLALGEAGFGAGGCLGGVGYFGVNVRLNALRLDHSSFRVEGVVARRDRRAIREGLPLDKGVAQIYADILQKLVALVNEVELPLVLDQLVLLLADAVLVEVVTVGAVLDDHPTFRVELIVSHGNRSTVLKGEASHKDRAEIDTLASDQLVPFVDEIEVALIFHQAVFLLQNAVLIEMISDGTVQYGGHAVRTAIVVDGYVSGEISHDTGLHIAALVEKIGLPFDQKGL